MHIVVGGESLTSTLHGYRGSVLGVNKLQVVSLVTALSYRQKKRMSPDCFTQEHLWWLHETTSGTVDVCQFHDRVSPSSNLVRTMYEGGERRLRGWRI